MNKIPTRLILYARDVQNITGRAERYSQRLLRQVNQYFNKPPDAMVTVFEFCEYTRLKIEHILPYLK